jgi:histone H3/H4
VKKLVRDLSDYNTSQCAIDALTEKVVQECKKAIEGARASGRKTIMGRDFET